MSEPRIPMLDADAAKAAALEAGVPEDMARLSVFRVLLQNPTLTSAVYKLLSTLLWKTTLDGRLRELVIMRIAWRTDSVYEWTQHWRVAGLMNIPEADVLAVRDWRSDDRFGAAERAVLAATDETLDMGTISPQTWDECAEHLSPNELLELIVAIGNWRMFSSLLRSVEVPLEEGVEPWPPDGAQP
jgi:alkylhydroperoxidase family enzyme